MFTKYVKTVLILLTLLIVGVAVAAANENDPLARMNGGDKNRMAEAVVNHIPAYTYQLPMRVHVSQNPATPIVPDSYSRVVTTDKGATVTVVSGSLTPGNAVTVWLAVANKPAACNTSPCTASDVLGKTAAIEAQVTYGSGQVVDENGRVVMQAYLPAGPVPGGWYAGQEFTHPTSAEIHIILNDHGPVLPELMPEMINTYRAGCTDESLPPPFPPSAKADGTPGPNTCRLVQFAIFQQK